MRSIILTALFTLVALAGQAKTYKTIKALEAMACVNVYRGEIRAREVIMRDTATTVHFTIEYPKGETFRFDKGSYLMDEDGNRYALRACEGIPLNEWIKSPESGVTDFTMHFEPLPKTVQIFDFTEGDVNGAFMLLGIHDRKYKIAPPTLQQLSDANPYTVPADWFTTDTITIRGRIEGYSAEKFGFTSMECYYEDVFEKDDATLVLDIAPDGSFEKKFQVSYPIHQRFVADGSKLGFNELPFFARPGETIDITVKPNESGFYECYHYPITLNRIQFAKPVRNRQYDGLTEGLVENIVEHERKIQSNNLAGYRELMGSEGDNIMAQLSIYKNMLSFFSGWRNNENSVSKILADTTMTADQREKAAASLPTVDKMMPLYLGVFSHPVIHQKAEQFYAYKMAQTELSTPLPADNASAALIRSLCAKYPGRYLMIDFWGMGCGPCRSAIEHSKALRAEVAKRDDIKLIFIAEERTAEGSEAYHNYVKEWLANEEAFCVSKADFTRMQELFRFNGIPHYETITPDGRRVRDDLRISGYHSFNYELNRLKEQLKD